MEEVCTDDPATVSDAQSLVSTVKNFEFILGAMGERVVPLAVQPPLQLLCHWQLVIFWELQLLFLEQ